MENKNKLLCMSTREKIFKLGSLFFQKISEHLNTKLIMYHKIK